MVRSPDIAGIERQLFGSSILSASTVAYVPKAFYEAPSDDVAGINENEAEESAKDDPEPVEMARSPEEEAEKKRLADLEAAKENQAARVINAAIRKFLKVQNEPQEDDSDPFISFWCGYVAVSKSSRTRLRPIVLGATVELSYGVDSLIKLLKKTTAAFHPS